MERSVLNMNQNEKQHEQIMISLIKIERDIKGVNDRLDRINGTVAKNSNRLDTLENWKSNVTGRILVISIVTVPIVAAIINLIFKNYFK